MRGSTYDQRFYDVQSGPSASGAEAVVPMIMRWLAPSSVVDFGCGLGTWLEKFSAAGVGDILGIDGDHVDLERLRIDSHRFRPADLSSPPDLGRRFGLAVSLEVAEHLQPRHARKFVSALTRASDVVLFSAAIPGQTGTGHVNEQWPGYWVELFADHGYQVLDVLRLEIWDDDRVPYWYRQNMLLFTRTEHAADVRERIDAVDISREGSVVSLVHPLALTAARPNDSSAIRRALIKVRRLAVRS